MHKLLGGRLRTPHPVTLTRHTDDMKADHDFKLLGVMQEMSEFKYPMGTVEIDIWEAPNKQHWVALLLLTVTPDFHPKTYVLYVGKIAEKTAREQANRMISVVKKFGNIDVSDLVWVVSSGNAGSAFNVATVLKMECLRCGAHVVALAQSICSTL